MIETILNLPLEVRALLYIHKMGWMRSLELGRILFHGGEAQRQRADSLLKRMLKRRLLIVRQLPERAGKAYVLSKRGADLLSNSVDFDDNVVIKSGKDLGKKTKNEWIPAHSWRHDLLVAGYVSMLDPSVYFFYVDRELRNVKLGISKVPDALVLVPSLDFAMWVEVENSRKTGKNQRTLAEALCIATSGTLPLFRGCLIRNATVVYPKMPGIDHRLRVRNAVAEHTSDDVNITFSELILRGNVSVDSISNELVTIQSEKFRKIRKQLEHYYKKTPEGNLEAYYGGFFLAIDTKELGYKDWDGSYLGKFRAWAGGDIIEQHTPAFESYFNTISEAKEYLAKKVVEFS